MTMLSLWKGNIKPCAGGKGVSVRPDVRDALVEFVARKHGVRPHEVMGKRGYKALVHARHEVAWRLRQIDDGKGHAKHSYPLIAKAMGWSDHTSAIHAVQAHAARNGLQ